MHVALLFPGVTDPRSPHLALPSLAAVLRAAGVRVTMRDLDLEGLLWLCHPERVAEAVRVCRDRAERTADTAERARLLDALLHAEYVTRAIGDAPALLRDPARFYQPHLFHAARETIVRALDLVSAAAGPVRYSTAPVRYDVDGRDATRLDDLEAVTADPRLNLFLEHWQETLLPDLDRDRPDVVGISILNFQQVIPGLMLARLLKERGHFVVIGGTVYSKFVPQLMARPRFFELFCDGLVAYEGESALLALLDQLAGRRDLASVPNLLHLDERGRVVMGSSHAEDVNTLPVPDFDGLPLDQYLAPEPVLPILTGKGCYFNRCRFCDIPFINKVAGKAYRVRTPDRIAADIATLHRRHGARHFEITDEALAPRLLMHLADALDDYPEVDARFVGYARLEPGFTPEVCRRIHEMGVRKLFFGLESGSQATLDHMDKGIRIPAAVQVLRNCREAGIGFHLFSIVGFPEETEERARETVQFFLDHQDVIDHPRNSFDIHPFTLDLRTSYADEAERFGVEVDLAELAGHDFPLSADRWRNRRGIDDESTSRLLAEFHATLRRTYPDYRQFPAHLWPGFEEYAVLYARHYEDRPFAHRFTLPPPGEPLPIRLVWSESVRVEEAAEGLRIACITGHTLAHRAMVMLLGAVRPPMPVDALLEALAAQLSPEPEQRQALAQGLRGPINALLATGALRLEPSTDEVLAHT